MLPDKLVSAGNYATKSGIEWELRINPDWSATLIYAPVGPDYEGDTPCTASRNFPDVDAAADYLDWLSHIIAQLPLPELSYYQTFEAVGTAFCGVNSYLGRWEFDNGYGVSLCRKNFTTQAGEGFDLMVFKGYKTDRWGNRNPAWVDYGELPDGDVMDSFGRDNINGYYGWHDQAELNAAVQAVMLFPEGGTK